LLLQVQMLLEEGVAPKDIGVIAPYNAQVHHYRYGLSCVSSIFLLVSGPTAALALCFKVHRPCCRFHDCSNINRNFVCRWFPGAGKRGVGLNCGPRADGSPHVASAGHCVQYGPQQRAG
jgi:hypothetical protein